MRQIIETVAYITTRDKKLLLVLTHGNKTYYMPGGKKEAGETNTQALIRELKEELSIDIIPESIKPYETFEAQAHGKPDGTLVRISCFTGEHTGECIPNREIIDFQYFSEEEYRKTPDPAPIGILINKHLKTQGIID